MQFSTKMSCYRPGSERFPRVLKIFFIHLRACIILAYWSKAPPTPALISWAYLRETQIIRKCSEIVRRFSANLLRKLQNCTIWAYFQKNLKNHVNFSRVLAKSQIVVIISAFSFLHSSSRIHSSSTRSRLRLGACKISLYPNCTCKCILADVYITYFN